MSRISNNIADTTDMPTDTATHFPPPPMVRFCVLCCVRSAIVRASRERRRADDLENIIQIVGICFMKEQIGVKPEPRSRCLAV